MSNPQSNKNILPISQRVVGLCYALFTAACFLPLWPLFLVGVAVKLYWQNRAHGTWLESHFEYQKDSLLVAFMVFATLMALSSGILGLVKMPEILSAFLPGASRIITVLTAVWLAFRMIKGWIRLHQYLPMGAVSPPPAPTTAAAAADAMREPEPEVCVKSATRSLSATVLPLMLVANIATLSWIVGEISAITNPADKALMSAILFVPVVGWAFVGPLVYGGFLVAYWTSLPPAAQEGRVKAWLLTAACLVMMLLNTIPLTL